MPDQPAFFESQPTRRIYNQDTDTWWFSVVDIIKILTQQPDTRKAGLYWGKLKQRLRAEGSQLDDNCHQLKLPAEDGKQRLTDCAQVETLLRLIQSVPSPKAEPIKLWLAKVGYERMQEVADPSLSIDRAREVYKKQGRSEKWIAGRITGQETRNKLTDYWSANDVKPGQECAILTNLIHQEWSEVSVKEHKDRKGPKVAKPTRPHERGRTDLHSARRTLHPPGRRNHRSQRPASQSESRPHRRPDRQARPP